MQRAGMESILGLRIQGKFLLLDPCIPRDWRNFEMTVRHGSARYEIMVENPDKVMRGVRSAEFDGQAVTQRPVSFPLLDDAMTHRIRVTLGE